MLPENRTVPLQCPAKLNLSLAILGKREDGFHALNSVVAQVALADNLELSWSSGGGPESDSVKVEGAELPEGDNTVAAAIRLFRNASGVNEGTFTARLEKGIPVGAGLGGGSSDGAGALRAIQSIFANHCPDIDWSGLASGIGSDCPLFLESAPVIMEGRGERITPLSGSLARRFRGQPVILFKPQFSINTGEAYRRLARGGYYQDTRAVEQQMESWQAGVDPLPPRNNDFERLVEDWLPGLAVLLHRLRTLHGLDARMSGSGSACFVFSKDQPFARNVLVGELTRAFRDQYWIEETVLN